MSVSDAILVGGDWISEHYLTTDATSQSFKAQVLSRRKAWDAADGDTVRSRFTAARGDLLARLAQLEEAPGTASDLRRDLQLVLGYGAIGLTHETTGPLTLVTRHSLPDVAGLALVAAAPVDSAEDLLDKDAPTLTQTWEPEDGDPVTSVARLLSTVFVDEDGPAFALVLAGRVALLAERERWAEGRYLALDLQLVCERNDTTRAGEVDRALACLAAESLAPDAEGDIWWSRVLEESVKHTVGVSQDLREGVRLSIEIIANEVVARRRAQGLDPLPQDEAQPLAKQALRYLYRILFLLYAEASPELGVLPVNATEYDQGYSLDRLRELVQVPLTTPRAESGTHLYDSLGVLFGLVDSGYAPVVDPDEGLAEPLQFRSLRADLFRPEAVAHVDEVRLGNAPLQQVLQHLLLSKESRGRDRGFISYAELGINQLGAVYEGLMSYTGRFAEIDLYEVAKNGDSSKGSWLVPVERAGDIDDKDFVRIEDPVTGEARPVLHREGAFVFRLAGRERQQSASYYTPEVLTRFTVGQALEELLDQDGQRTSAEEILGLTVCEPALGSGAFAIEAVRQLAAEYLKRRQEELGERIDPEAYARELQQVKAYLALHNVYGVDLNATAVELAEISLWLDTMVEGLHAPWFGLHLRRGNSLIGARKAVFTRKEVADKSWLKAVPRKVVPGSTSPDQATSITGHVPHFLLPADGWGAAADVGKDIKDLVPEAVQRLKAWRRSMVAKPTKRQVDRLVAMSERVERLWEIAGKRLEIANQQTRRDIPLWNGNPKLMTEDGATGVEEVAQQPSRNPASTDRHVTREEIEASLADPDGAYRRLRLVMDAWCALWFWPLTEDPDAGGVAPPTPEHWYAALAAILGGTGSVKEGRKGDDTFADLTTWDDLRVAEELDRDFAGASRIERVLADHPWLTVCQRVAAQQGFFHWELDFAQILDRGGFDMQVGNPPWVVPSASEEPLLAELDPWWVLKDRTSQSAESERRARLLVDPAAVRSLTGPISVTTALAAFVTSSTLYPVLGGSQPDLYRSFIVLVWRNSATRGVAGLVHPGAFFTDERAGRLRTAAYRRLRKTWHFINEFNLFEIGHQRPFAVHVYGQVLDEVNFAFASGLYHPDTVVRSLRHDGSGVEPGVRNAQGLWDTSPHASRIFRVTEDLLRSWSTVSGSQGDDPLEAKMVFAVNTSAMGALEALARQPSKIASVAVYCRGWNESVESRGGNLAVRWGTPESWDSTVLQGAQISVSNPLYQVPGEEMRSHLDWTPIDLEQVGENFVPATKYKPNFNVDRFQKKFPQPQVRSGVAISQVGLFRLAWRSMAAPKGERTLMPALIPPGTTYVSQSVYALAVPDKPRILVLIAGVASSLLADSLVRAIPKSSVPPSIIGQLPLIQNDEIERKIVLRTLRLNALTSAYRELWRDVLVTDDLRDAWACSDSRLGSCELADVSLAWGPEAPVRVALCRRQAQLEIDVLTAIAVGVSIDELCTVYRTQFGVLVNYDRNTTHFDANGRLVPNSVLTRWRKKGDSIGQDERTATNTSGITYTYALPFSTMDREADMRQAYAHFEKVLAERGGA